MTQGVYTITTVPSVQKNDNSFKSMLCAMLIFLTLCLIIILLSVIPWKAKYQSKEPETNGLGTYYAISGNITTKRTTTDDYRGTEKYTPFEPYYEEKTTKPPKPTTRSTTIRKEEIKTTTEKLTESTLLYDIDVRFPSIEETDNTTTEDYIVTEKDHEVTEKSLETTTIKSLNETEVEMFKSTHSHLDKSHEPIKEATTESKVSTTIAKTDRTESTTESLGIIIKPRIMSEEETSTTVEKETTKSIKSLTTEEIVEAIVTTVEPLIEEETKTITSTTAETLIKEIVDTTKEEATDSKSTTVKPLTTEDTIDAMEATKEEAIDSKSTTVKPLTTEKAVEVAETIKEEATDSKSTTVKPLTTEDTIDAMETIKEEASDSKSTTVKPLTKEEILEVAETIKEETTESIKTIVESLTTEDTVEATETTKEETTDSKSTTIKPLTKEEIVEVAETTKEETTDSKSTTVKPLTTEDIIDAMETTKEEATDSKSTTVKPLIKEETVEVAETIKVEITESIKTTVEPLIKEETVEIAETIKEDATESIKTTLESLTKEEKLVATETIKESTSTTVEPLIKEKTILKEETAKIITSTTEKTTEEIKEATKKIKTTSEPIIKEEIKTSTSATEEETKKTTKAVEEVTETFDSESKVSYKAYDHKEVNETTTISTLKESSKYDEDRKTTIEVFDRMKVIDSSTTEEPLTSPDLVYTTETKSTLIVPFSTTPTTVERIIRETPCVTEACKEVAADILSSINFGAAPCDEFYKFSCGRLKDNSISYEEMMKRRSFERMSDGIRNMKISSIDSASYKFKNFYTNCIKYRPSDYWTTNIISVKNSLLKVSKLYTKLDEVEDSTADFLSQLFIRHKIPLFDLDLNVENSENFVIELNLPKTTNIDDPEGYLNENRISCNINANKLLVNNPDLVKAYNAYSSCMKQIKKYIDNIKTVVKTLKFYEGLELFNRTQYIEKIKYALELDIFTNLNSANSVAEKQIAINKGLYENFTLAEMSARWSAINWFTFFSNIFGTTVPETTKVRVYFVEYFDKIFKDITYDKSIRNTLISMYAYDLYMELLTNHHTENREGYCLRLTSRLMPDVATNIYLNTFKEETFTEIQENTDTIFNKLKYTVEKIVKNSYSPDMATLFNDKLSKMTLIMHEKLNDSLIDERYEEFKPSNCFIDDYVNLTYIFKKNKFSMIDRVPSSQENSWFVSPRPYDSEATVLHSQNSIVVPYAMIADIDMKKTPNYVLISQVGYKIARLIANQFTSIGIKHGMRENLDITREIHNNEECIIDNNAYRYKSGMDINGRHVTFKINSTLAMYSQVSDIIALNIAFETYKEEPKTKELTWLNGLYSNDQVFFISLAQQYCYNTDLVKTAIDLAEKENLPAKIRLDSMLYNDDHFAKAFECRLGSTLNPSHKCKQFPDHDLDYDVVPT